MQIKILQIRAKRQKLCKNTFLRKSPDFPGKSWKFLKFPKMSPRHTLTKICMLTKSIIFIQSFLYTSMSSPITSKYSASIEELMRQNSELLARLANIETKCNQVANINDGKCEGEDEKEKMNKKLEEFFPVVASDYLGFKVASKSNESAATIQLLEKGVEDPKLINAIIMAQKTRTVPKHLEENMESCFLAVHDKETAEVLLAALNKHGIKPKKLKKKRPKRRNNNHANERQNGKRPYSTKN